MNIRFLDTLVWLARLKSFSLTATKLNITQPAISSRMDRLEEEFGVEIYEKRSRDFELTVQGRRILGYAEQIVDLWKEARATGWPGSDGLSEFRIGVIEVGALSWLSRFLRGFEHEFPKTATTLTSGTTDDLLQQLRDETIDIAFVVGPVNEPSLRSDQVCSFSMEWFVNPNVFPITGEIDVIELSRMPIIKYGAGSSAYNVLKQYFEIYEIRALPPHTGHVTINSVYSSWGGAHAASEGLGVIALPSFLFRREVEAGQLARLPVRQRLPALNITACYRSTFTSPILRRAIILACEAASDFAKSQVDSEFWI